MNIIVAMDNKAFVTDAIEALRSAGFMATGCTDPYDAATAIDSGSRLDLLIAEVASSGLVLARIAKLRHPGLTVLLVTDLFDARAAYGAGETIPWPITVPHLVRIVRRQFDPLVVDERDRFPPWLNADGVHEADGRPLAGRA